MLSSTWQVLLVTGGQDSNYDGLDSTELLVLGSGSWRLATGLLPRPIWGVGVATLENTLYLTGKIVNTYIVERPVLIADVLISRWN